MLYVYMDVVLQERVVSLNDPDVHEKLIRDLPEGFRLVKNPVGIQTRFSVDAFRNQGLFHCR